MKSHCICAILSDRFAYNSHDKNIILHSSLHVEYVLKYVEDDNKGVLARNLIYIYNY